MQRSKLKPLFCLTTVEKLHARSQQIAAGATQIKPWSDIPGPSSLPIIGQMHHFFPKGELYDLKGSPLEKWNVMHKRYGPMMRLNGMMGGPNALLLFDPESSAHILRSENWLPRRPGFDSIDYYRKNKKDNNAKYYGLMTDHGEVWKEFRSTVNPVLLQPKTIRLYSAKIDEVSLDMISRMRSIRDKNNRLEGKFETEMNLWSLESVGLVALGRRLNCFDKDLPDDSPEKRIIEVVRGIFTIADELDFKPSIWKWYATKTFKQAMKLYEEQENLARHFIDKTIEELNKKSEIKSEDEKSVLEKLLEINKEVAVVMASDMFLAGVDTTSNTITAALYLLANNQEKQEKLREEVISGQDKRPYLRACIKESLRMMPVTAGVARTLTKDYTVLGYNVPKGTIISCMTQSLSMLEQQYPRPNEYIPERWLVSKEDPLYHGNAHPFAYLPFGFGSRSCLGRRIAELELETFLARIIQNFRVEWDGPPVKIVQASLNYVTGPFHFVFNDV